jgi:hypothetical protein
MYGQAMEFPCDAQARIWTEDHAVDLNCRVMREVVAGV